MNNVKVINSPLTKADNQSYNKISEAILRYFKFRKVGFMATSSIYHNVVIKGRRKCKKFLKAIEDSKSCPPPKVEFKKPVRYLTEEEIEELFGGKGE